MGTGNQRCFAGGVRRCAKRIVLGAVLLAATSVILAGSKAGATTTTCAPLTQGYWKTHQSVWFAKVKGLTLGTTFYTDAQLLTILNTPPKGDASLILADQLIAALL